MKFILIKYIKKLRNKLHTQTLINKKVLTQVNQLSEDVKVLTVRVMNLERTEEVEQDKRRLPLRRLPLGKING